jgi:DNA-directed RNA polymerase sigma subunit (sigma70/sigma32)
VSEIQKALREHALIHVPRMRTIAKSDRPTIHIHSLNASANEAGGAREDLIDLLVDGGDPSPEEQVAVSETKGALQAFMERVLSPEERDALCQHYQLDGANSKGEDSTQTSATISALRTRALNKLRLASLPEKEKLMELYANLN